MNDPIIAELRKHREEHAREFNHDLDAICADLMARQERSGRRLVRLKPRPVAANGIQADPRTSRR